MFKTFCFIAFAFLLPLQDMVVFRAERHLEGWDEITFSEYSRLYDFSPFEEWEGKRISARDLEALCTLWDKEIKRVDIEIQKIQEDPSAFLAFQLEKKFRFHSYFSQIDLVKDTSREPMIFFIQPPRQKTANYNQRIVDHFGPCLTKLMKEFREEFAMPMDLKIKGKRGAMGVAVLSRYAEYAGYLMESGGCVRSYDDGAAYSSSLPLVVTYESAIKKMGIDKSRSEVIYAGALSVMYDYCHNKTPKAGYYWLRRGLPRYLANHFADEACVLRDEEIRDYGIMLNNTSLRPLFFVHVRDLVEIRSYEDLYEIAKRQAGSVAEKDPNWDGRLFEYFLKEAGLFVEFMLKEEGGRHRTWLLQSLKAWSTGEELEDRVDLPWGLVHKKFVAFLDNRLKATVPQLCFSESMKDLLINTGLERRTDETDSSDVLDLDFKPDALGRWEMDEDLAMIMALHEVTLGAFREGAGKIRDFLTTRHPDGEGKKRLEKELKRMEALLALRDFVLDDLQRGGKKKLRIEHKGNIHLGTVDSFDEDMVHLKPSRGSVVSLPIHVIDCNQVFKYIRGRKLKVKEGWVTAYAALLTGSKAWKIFCKGTGPEGDALQADSEYLKEYLALTVVYRLLNDLGRSQVPAGTEEGQALLDKICELLQTYGETPLVKSKKKLLLKFAAYAYWELFHKSGLAEASGLHGKMEDLPDGVVRLSYTFDSPDELLDFKPVDYMDEERADFGDVTLSVEESFFKVESGEMICRGQACRRLNFFLKAPMKIKYKVVFSSREVGKDFPAGWFVVGFCDDGYGNCIRSILDGGLIARHKKNGFYETDGFGGSYMGDTTYTIEIIHDGKTVKSITDGALQATVPCGLLVSGGVFLWIHHDVFVDLKSFSVEGNPDPKYILQLRDEWVTRKVAELGGE